MARALQPVSIAGIEFDALIDATKTMTSTVPAYTVETGFAVSDTIVLEPLQLTMTLYVSNTPVTWLNRHGSSQTRIDEICKKIESLWAEKSLVKIVTSEAIYTDMAVTSISIKKSKELGYSREIQVTCQKVRTVSQKTTSIPAYSLKSGTTGASGGSASTSSASGSGTSSTSGGTNSGDSDSGTTDTGGTDSSGSSSSGSSGSGESDSSILYKIGTALGVI